MRLDPADRILTRIGAGDRLARGMSTFLVEMTETARILREMTPASLVVLDEIGRGTSTYDGLAIAWAVAEAVAGRGARALFATHYHELADLDLPGVGQRNARVREWDGRVVFLYEIAPGPADRSYGIQVAALAGVPDDVTRRAKDVLLSLEMGGRPGKTLPLFRP
jgi:DNA mismatch repair protein MutS